tara:strand:- start:607 stop:774 length:168 start_codon:yes stop_codon:yes gene_type:complete
MEKIYTVDEILKAVDDLQRIKKIKTVKTNTDPKNYNLNIPVNTLKLIEEAEKVKN